MTIIFIGHDNVTNMRIHCIRTQNTYTHTHTATERASAHHMHDVCYTRAENTCTHPCLFVCLPACLLQVFVLLSLSVSLLYSHTWTTNTHTNTQFSLYQTFCAICAYCWPNILSAVLLPFHKRATAKEEEANRHNSFCRIFFCLKKNQKR